MEPQLNHTYIAKKARKVIKLQVLELTKTSIRIKYLDSDYFDRQTLEDFKRDYLLIEDLGSEKLNWIMRNF